MDDYSLLEELTQIQNQSLLEAQNKAKKLDEVLKKLNDELDAEFEKQNPNDQRVTTLLETFNAIDKYKQDLQNIQDNISSEEFLKEEESIKSENDKKYLGQDEIEYLHNETLKEVPLKIASSISEEGKTLESEFLNFASSADKSQVVYVCQNNHWISVRLEKTKNGITYQVADSLAGEGYEKRSKEIDRIFNYEGVTRIPFNSTKQNNGYDCGIYAVLNAKDMCGGYLENGLTSQKSTFSYHDIETARNAINQKRIENKINDKILNIQSLHKNLQFDLNQVMQDVKINNVSQVSPPQAINNKRVNNLLNEQKNTSIRAF